jgi:hypothetical protein
MATYTTATLVRKRVEAIDASLTDADIEQYILEAETVIDCIMKDSLISTFNSIDHAILRSCASDLAAMSCIQYNPAAFASAEGAEIAANLLQENIQLNFYMLSDPRVIEYLKSRGDLKAMNLISTTTVDFSATGQTTLYTVPAGQIFIPTMAIIRTGANAAATDVTFGRVGALTDWLGTIQLDNLDADGDQVKIEQSNANPPTKAKTYAAGVVFQINVTVAAGGATNYVDLFGYLIGA